MTNEQRAALDLALLNLKTHGDDQLLTAIKPLLEFYESHRAAGASEGQAEMKWPCKRVTAAWDEHGRVMGTVPECVVLRERIAGMEKDAERYRKVRSMASSDMLKLSVIFIPEDFDEFVDAAIAKEKQG